MRLRLKWQYLLILGPAVIGFAMAAVLRGTGTLPWTLPLPWARAVFVTAVVLAAGLPLWFRVFFVRRAATPEADRFYRFQQRLMVTALVPAYLALAAYAFGAPGFLGTGTLLAALYGAYYFYPSSARLKADIRIFRRDREGAL